ncbi:MAG: FAD-binding oxidoreductase [Myxococcota bacterium]|nr:FAD-binding oxidoreductase [Myxococcota bacterium]
MSPALIGALAQRFGERCVVADPERCARYAGDWSGLSPQTPELVVRPETTEQAAELVAHLYQLGVPVTFRGAGTGKAGGCIPSPGSVVLSTERMNGAPIVRADDLVVSCSAGTLAARLDEEAAAHGLFYPPDPNSLAISSIGGNVATNAGGPKAVKYGLTGHYLLGLTYVGAQGEVVRTGADTIKSVAGTNLSGLLLGSEGTFGLITEVTMRLVARPQTVQTALLTFESTAAAVQAVGALFRSGVMPRCAELLDEISCDTISNLEQHALPQGCQAALILETDGTEDQSLDELLTLTKAAQPLETMVAQTPSQRERIWAPRRDLSVALRDRRALKVSEDIAVPRGQLATAVERIREAASATPFEVATYGHAGDGNLHVNILFDREAQRAEVEALQDHVFRIAIDLSGTITGEHGIGLAKRHALPWEAGAARMALEHRLKAVMDPKLLFNPGKVLGA